jgi:ABC-2 type transport system permease protein
MNTMKWLLKREYWENRGGLFMAPAIISIVMVVIAVLMVAAFTYGLQTGSFEHNGMTHVSLATMLGEDGKAKAVEGIASVFGLAAAPLGLVMTFVVFFYLIGSLYDDRANRSVLFWKSLPLSDRETVASKLVTALVVAPLFTMAIATIASIVLAILGTIAFAINGVSVAGAVFGNTKLYTLPFEVLGTLPVYILWTLPTAGWLMMVSAWARTFPFLWSVGVPLVVGVLVTWVSWIAGMFGVHVGVGFFWQNVIGRLLLSVMPGSWTFLLNDPSKIHPDALEHASPLITWNLLATPELWIGVVVGAAMILAAIRLRRYRDEG